MRSTSVLTLFLTSTLLATVDAWGEFGRQPKLKRIGSADERMNRLQREPADKDEISLNILKELQEVLDEGLSMSMSLSMSLSYDYGSSSDDSSSRPPISSTPSPTSIPSDFPSSTPSAPPSTTLQPSGSPSIASSEESGFPSNIDFPTSPTSSTRAPVSQTEIEVFQCVEGSIALGVPAEDSVPVVLSVGYLVESTSQDPQDFIERLETALLGTALLAALQCNAGDNVGGRRNLMGQSSRALLEDTSIVGTCTPEVEEAQSCHFMETDISFFVNGDIDPDEAAYAGYIAIEQNMEDGTYVTLVDQILRIVYLSPLPLPSPPQLNADGETLDPSTKSSSKVSSTGDSEVSPWTIGACVATIMGGVISLAVWNRNRRARQLGDMVDDEESMDGRDGSSPSSTAASI